MKVMTSVGTGTPLKIGDPEIDTGISRMGRKDVREGTLKASEVDCLADKVSFA